MSATVVLFSTLAVLILLNVPIAVSLGLASVITLIVSDISLSLFASLIAAALSRFTLLAIPFFILAGTIMEKSGISDRLIKFANKLVSHLPAGLAMVAVITSLFFAAISGSGPATVAALGVILIPAMVKAGYPKDMSSALLASSGAIGIIIPPSIAFVVYGVTARVSIGKMFIAGIIPGILMGLAFIICSLILVRNHKYERSDSISFKEVVSSFFEAFWGLLTPFIILGGIYSGYFTPTEAAAVAVVYGLLVGLFIYREIKLKDLFKVLTEAAKSTSVVMLIVANASVFAWIINTEGIAIRAANLLLAISTNEIILLLIINVLLLIVGCFIDAISVYYILVPILMPVAFEIGYDPVALGVMMTVNLAIGQITPPVGVNLYVACGIANLNIKQITRAVLPFLVAALIVLFLITYFPQISTWLPDYLDM